MRRIGPALAALACIAAATTPGEAQGAFGQLFGGEGCYARSYDARHLAAHPRQRVTSIVLAYRPVTQAKQKGTPERFEVGIGLKVKGDSELYARVGYCRAKGAGFACSLESDGGQVELAAEGSALRLTTTRIGIEGSTRSIEVGGAASDDSTFVMARAAGGACAAVRRATR